jgi:hypothetical protein
MGFFKVKLPIELIIFFYRAAGNKNANCHDDNLPGKIRESNLNARR